MRGFILCLSPLLIKLNYFFLFLSYKKSFGIAQLFIYICLYLFFCYFPVKYHQHSFCLLLGNWRSFTVPWPRMGSNYWQKETLWLVRSCHFEICSYDQRIHCVSITDFALHLEVIILCFTE